MNNWQPKKLINDELIRLGNPRGDGGYAISKSLLNTVDVLYSYGVGDNSTFENHFTDITGKPTHLYDHTVDCNPIYSNHTFHKEGLSGLPTYNCNNYLNHIQQNGDEGKNVLLKIDVEGSEYNWIYNTDMKELGKTVKGLIIEFHNVVETSLAGSLNPLKEEYNIIHWHSNNFGGSFQNIPAVPEISFLHKDIIIGDYVMGDYPIVGLDIPNNGKEETYFYRYS
jgi:hypothetical protein